MGQFINPGKEGCEAAATDLGQLSQNSLFRTRCTDGFPHQRIQQLQQCTLTSLSCLCASPDQGVRSFISYRMPLEKPDPGISNSNPSFCGKLQTKSVLLGKCELTLQMKCGDSAGQGCWPQWLEGEVALQEGEWQEGQVSTDILRRNRWQREGRGKKQWRPRRNMRNTTTV